MPVRIENEWVASRDDFNRLDSRLNDLARSYTELQNESRKLAQENQQRIRNLETTLTQQISRVDKLTTNLTNLDQAFQSAVNTIEQTFDTINGEVTKTGVHLAESNKAMQASADQLARISTAVQDQAQNEANQRQALSAWLERTRAQQKALAITLQGAFDQLHEQLTGLVQIEQNGARLV